MEYRRRRTGGRRPRETGSGSAFRALSLMIIFAAAAYLILGTGVGKKLKEIGEAKLSAGCALPARTPEPSPAAVSEAPTEALPTPAETPEGASVRVSLPPVDICMIQMGIFDSAESCEEAAKAIRALGAAGYVYDDNGSYRLIAAAFSDAGSAENVKEQLEKAGRQCTLFTRSYDGVELLVTAPEARIEPIRRAFELAYDAVERLDALSIELDRETRSAEYGIGALNDIRGEIGSVAAGIENESASGRMMELIYRYYTDLNGMISECAGAGNDRTVFSSALKSLRIKAAVRYSALLSEIGG